MNSRDIDLEINEAVNAANDALYYLSNAEEMLKSARNWGIADLLGGQMLISAVKNGKMHSAELELQKAQKALSKLNKELGDIGEFYTIRIDANSLLGAVDIFFDNPITDILTQSRIKDTMRTVSETIAQVEGVLDALDEITIERSGQ